MCIWLSCTVEEETGKLGSVTPGKTTFKLLAIAWVMSNVLRSKGS